MTDTEQRVRQRRIVLFAIVGILALAADIVTKIVAVGTLPDPGVRQHSVSVLGGVLHFNLLRNSGAAFSMGTGFTIVLSAIALVVVVVIVRTARRLHSAGWAVALGLILGGALGNLGDRIFRDPGVGRGHVVDFISLFGPYDKYWPVFNVADSAICVGAVIAAILAVLGINLDGTRAEKKQRA